MSPGKQSSFSLYDSFIQKMVLKRPFISDTGQNSALHVLLSMSPGKQSSFSLYDSFIQKMVLKRPFISDTGQDSALHVCCPCLLGGTALSQYDSFI